MKKNDNKNTGAILSISAGVAALAAGVYYFFGPDAKKHQKNMKGWIVKMKGEVIEKLEAAQEVTEPVYNEIVDKVATAYLGTGTIAREEITDLVNNLKKQWKNISGQVKKGKSVIKKSAQKAVATTKKATTKTVKGITKKVISTTKKSVK